jgi:K+-transporting ATPase ATPase C chain
MASARSAARTTATAVRATVLLTVLLGVAYPLLVTGIGQVAFHEGANGSLVANAGGHVVGSALIGQRFADGDGNPLPGYFQPRPSAAGDGYDAADSGGSNLGPENTKLIAEIRRREARIAAFDHVEPAAIPAEAVTASASGLDPDISPAYALLQVDRVATARGLPAGEVRSMVTSHAAGRSLGYLGRPRVNVVLLNLALDRLPQ